MAKRHFPQKIPTKLSASLRQFFWDVDATKLNPSKHPLYVINRLLDMGNLNTVRWVLHNFPRDVIIETVKTRRDFSFSTAAFWARYFGIPREEVKCFQEPYRSLRKKYWPH